MSWLDIFRVEAEKRNAEAAAIASAAIEAERARLAEEAEEREAQRTARRKRCGNFGKRQAISSTTSKEQNHE